jgi:hypothetical protein
MKRKYYKYRNDPTVFDMDRQIAFATPEAFWADGGHKNFNNVLVLHDAPPYAFRNYRNYLTVGTPPDWKTNWLPIFNHWVRIGFQIRRS